MQTINQIKSKENRMRTITELLEDVVGNGVSIDNGEAFANVVNTTDYINIDKELDGINQEFVKTQLSYTIDEDGKYKLFLSGEPILLIPQGDRINITINGRKTIYSGIIQPVIALVMQLAERVAYLGGRDFDGYHIKYNGVDLVVWFSKENKRLYLKKFNPKNFENIYYKALREENKSISRTKRDYAVQLNDEIYGDSLSSLGSLVEDSVRDRVNELVEELASYASDDALKQIVLDALQANDLID